MLDTGYNHKVVYVLAQYPVYSHFSLRLCCTLKKVCKWFNLYIKDFPDHIKAQKIIRKLWYYRRVFETCVIDFVPARVQDTQNSLGLHGFPIEAFNTRFYRAYFYLQYVKRVKEKKTYTAFEDLCTPRQEVLLPIVYNSPSRELDLIKTITICTMGQTERKMEITTNSQRLVGSSILDETVMVRITFQQPLPLVLPGYTEISVKIFGNGCKDITRKYVHGYILPNSQRWLIAKNAFHFKNMITIDQFDRNGILLSQERISREYLTQVGIIDYFPSQ